MRKENIERITSDKIKKINKSHSHFLVYYYLTKDIEEALKIHAKGRLLDIGCGNKPYAIFLNETIEHVGCDIAQSSEMKVDLICPATAILSENNSFDTILCTQVLEHVEDTDKILSECYRVLKPGGKIILTCPMYWPLHEEPFDFFRFTKYGLKCVFEKAGFVNLTIKENGGKYSVLGIVLLQTLPFLPKFIKYISNSLFLFLDNRFYNTKNTTNYIVIGSKV